MLPPEHYQLVPPPRVQRCLACGARHVEGLQHVSFNTSADNADAVKGSIATIDHQPGATIYRGSNPGRDHVDPAAGTSVRQEFEADGTAVTTISHPQLCSACVKQAARLLDFGDTAPLQAELDERDRQLAEARERLLEADQAKQDAEIVALNEARRADVLTRAAAGDDSGRAKRPRSRAA